MNIDEIRSAFAKDLYATETTGASIDDAAQNYAKCSFNITDKHKNAAGGVMGGAIFTLADFAFAVAANVGNPITVSLSSNIAFHGAAKGNKLIAEAKCVKSGKSTCFFIVEIVDDVGTLVATASFTGFRKA